MTINETSRSKLLATLAFGLAIIFTLVLVAFWSGLLGSDKLEIVFTIPAGLILLISICIVAGITLRYIYGLERKVEDPKREVPVDYYLKIDDKKGKVFRGREEIKLARQEFELLKCLIDREGICDHDYILQQVWTKRYDDPNTPADTSNLNQLIYRLREKLNIHEYVKSHRGRGYEFVQWNGQQ